MEKNVLAKPYLQSFFVMGDLHTNLLCIPMLKKAAKNKLVFWMGDYTTRGGDVENWLIRKISSVGKAAIGVSGNHDTFQTLGMLRNRGIFFPELFARDSINVDDKFSVAAFGDPFCYSGDNPNGKNRILTWDKAPVGQKERDKADVLDWFVSFKNTPDLVMVHNCELAKHLQKHVADENNKELVILTAHDHKQWIKRDKNTLIIDSGSAGANGVNGKKDEKIGYAEVFFSTSNIKFKVERVRMVQRTMRVR